MPTNFPDKEFYKVGTKVSEFVLIKIQKHRNTLEKVRSLYKGPIIISKNSGYRPIEHELAKGRSGKSQHCFMGEGAVDVTGKDVRNLLKLLIEKSEYTRITYYPNSGFIHCDFAEKVLVTFIDLEDTEGWRRKDLSYLWSFKH